MSWWSKLWGRDAPDPAGGSAFPAQVELVPGQGLPVTKSELAHQGDPSLELLQSLHESLAST